MKKSNLKKIGVALSALAVATVNSMAAAGLDTVVTEAQGWITWGVAAIATILGAGVGIYAAKWAYRAIVKGGLGAA